jgi:hypothetical protein
MEELPRAGHLPRLLHVERAFEVLARTSLERRRSQIRPRNLEIAGFILVQAVEALTHAAVLHRPEMLRSEEFLDELTELVVRYLARARPPSRLAREGDRQVSRTGKRWRTKAAERPAGSR